MVEGLDRFVEHFRGLEDSYIIIGGAACDLWLESRGLPFRVTRDLDVVLVIEALTDEFGVRFWDFIHAGDYTSYFQSSERPQFYRFSDPQVDGFPLMIELLSRKPFKVSEGSHLAPFPVGEDQSSLSVILLDDTYYHFTVESREFLNDIPTLPASCLIPLKARACLDLSKRRAEGDITVRSHDIKKHRNDVFRLYRTLAPADRFAVPDLVRDDLSRFLVEFPSDSNVWIDIRQAVGDADLPVAEVILRQLRESFGISTPD